MTSSIDFGRTADDYGQHRQGFPDRFFAELGTRGIGRPGQRILDLGTGTGTVARGLARTGADVSALDPAAELLAVARSLDEQAGVAVQYAVGRAEELPFAAGSLDVVTAGQCWHWFDGPRVFAEVRRVLAPGGRLVIAHFDWLPLPATPVALTEQLILGHNPRWSLSGGTGFYPRWAEAAWLAGAQDIETYTFDLEVPYTHEAWRGRIRASAGVGASLSPEGVRAFDAAHEAALRADFPERILRLPHRVFTLLTHFERQMG